MRERRSEASKPWRRTRLLFLLSAQTGLVRCREWRDCSNRGQRRGHRRSQRRSDTLFLESTRCCDHYDNRNGHRAKQHHIWTKCAHLFIPTALTEFTEFLWNVFVCMGLRVVGEWGWKKEKGKRGRGGGGEFFYLLAKLFSIIENLTNVDNTNYPTSELRPERSQTTNVGVRMSKKKENKERKKLIKLFRM